MSPILSILLWSSIAAASAGLGAVFLIGRDRPPTRWLGWANAIAAGLMLGAAYAITVDGFEFGPVRAALGGVLGALFVAGTHRLGGTGDLDLNRLEESRPEYGYQILLIQALHSAWEGMAIGVAAVLDIRFGVAMAMIFLVHNVAESMIACAVLRGRGVPLRQAALLSVFVNVGQVLLAVVTFSVLSAAPAALPWVVGFAVGALVQLVVTELLPEAYEEAGAVSIALVTSLATGLIAFLQGVAF
jgi:zinc transporter ZupT